jgi:hypothetical protein
MLYNRRGHRLCVLAPVLPPTLLSCFFPMAPPVCQSPGCHHECSALSAGQRARWAADEGLKWAVITANLAYFFFCEECHRLIWPDDNRCNNRHSQPAETTWRRHLVNGVVRLIVGDLYVTRPPPELAQRGHGCVRRLPGQVAQGPPPHPPLAEDGPRVSWVDGGAWERAWVYSAGRLPHDIAWRRGPELRDHQDAQAEACGLVQSTTVVFEDRAPVPFRRGPCDACAMNDGDVFPVAAAYQNAPYDEKITVFLRQACVRNFYLSGEIHSDELESMMVPLFH